MLVTYEELSQALGHSTLVLQRAAVRAGVFAPGKPGVDDTGLAAMLTKRELNKWHEFTKKELALEPHALRVVALELNTHLHVDTDILEPDVVETQVKQELFYFYGEFENGQPLYKKEGELPQAKGTHEKHDMWSEPRPFTTCTKQELEAKRQAPPSNPYVDTTPRDAAWLARVNATIPHTYIQRQKKA